MAVNVAPSPSSDTAAEESAVQAEIRQMLNEVERLHQKMQVEEKKAEAAFASRQAALDKLKSDMKTLFGNGFAL